MKIAKITINSILGIDHLEIEPKSITEISGSNGVGKTSILEAIRSAIGAGNDATLLRKGASEGQVVLILDDGTEIKKRITEDKSDTQVIHPQFGKISKPATYLKKLADALSMNPVQFLTASKKDRVDQLLQAIPMQVTADQIGFVPTIALQGIDLEKHALEVIGQIGKAIYDLRTGVNRSEKDKRATVRQMSESLPEEAPEGENWGDVLQSATSEYQALQRETHARLSALDSAAAKEKQEAEKEYSDHVAAVKAELEEAIEKLRADAQIEINRTREGCDEAIQKTEQYRMERRQEEEQSYRPREAELKEKIGQAKAMVEQHAKAENTRQYIASISEEANKLEAESTKLTDALDQLDALKSGLLKQLPIDGLEVKEGDIYVGGIPFDRVNESKRIRLAIEIAKLRAGSLGLVAVDGLERLDPKTFELFKKEAAKSKLQFVISRVTDGPLTVETEKGAA